MYAGDDVVTRSPTHVEALSKLAANGQPFVAVTMLEAQGGVLPDAGAKMLIDRSGLVHGAVNAGKLEKRAIEFAQAIMDDDSRGRVVVDWNLQRDMGMTCDGRAKLLFEVYNRDDWHIVVFGAGHVAQSLVKVLLLLDCRVTCVDSRTEWIERMGDHDRLRKICVDDLTVEAEKLTPSDFVICMTMGQSADRSILSTIFRNQLEPAYLGVIGSKAKRGELLRELESDGIDPETAARFLCPIGLAIGSNQPAEIAISIVGQLLEYRDRIAVAQTEIMR